MFGARLKALREQAGLTQKQLAAKAGVSQRGIANWELGLRDPAWTNVLKLAEALGVEVGAFVGGPTKPKKGKGK
jgi:transcriptional regulator with XRE-family HTH domain